MTQNEKTVIPFIVIFLQKLLAFEALYFSLVKTVEATNLSGVVV